MHGCTVGDDMLGCTAGYAMRGFTVGYAMLGCTVGYAMLGDNVGAASRHRRRDRPTDRRTDFLRLAGWDSLTLF